MSRSLESCILELEKHGHLIRIREEVDPYLEMSCIHQKVFAAGGPALFFEKVKGSKFAAVSNLFGSKERWQFIFRKELSLVKEAVRLKANPPEFLLNMAKNFARPLSVYGKLPFTGLSSLPKKISPRKAPVLSQQCQISDLPQIVSWPMDGGAFITLPQVLSYSPGNLHPMKTNLGMYRVQLSGNDYETNKEIGLHYQIHRGIGIHHNEALQRGEDLPVSIFVGGHPAHSVAAVMPMPEGLSELIFAGMLSGQRFRYSVVGEHIVSADADFCILGWIRGKKTKPEGPFGDHLGYYSLTHDFPCLDVTAVYHRPKAIWPFTIVGRPPQEDSSFGELIHEITKPMVPVEIPGVKELHAVDVAGVHPLLLAIGSERYVPYKERKPLEILTQSHAVLGFNQCSLAKYLFIIAREDNEDLKAHDLKAYLTHMLERLDLKRDLHFHTQTSMDTLDYSSEELNRGSKLVVAVCGAKKRELSSDISHLTLPNFWRKPALVIPGILVIEQVGEVSLEQALQEINPHDFEGLPFVVIVDDSEFCSRRLDNFLWVTFTRSNPSHDIYGIRSRIVYKHWGCEGAMVIDARIKKHHAPPLEMNPKVEERVKALFSKNTQLKSLL